MCVYVQKCCVSFCVYLGSGPVLSHCCGWMDSAQCSHRMKFFSMVCVGAAALMSSDPQPGIQTSCVCQ